MWGFISTDRRKIETLRKEMCDSQGKMGKTTHTVAAAPFTSIKEQLKGYVKGIRRGSNQRHKQQKKSQPDEATVTLKHLNELTQAFEDRASIPHPVPPNRGRAACSAEPGYGRSFWPGSMVLPKEYGAKKRGSQHSQK